MKKISVITANKNGGRFIDETILSIKNHGIQPKEFFHNKKPWYYKMNTFGYNFRISDINCSLGSSQLLKLNRFVNKVFLIIGSSCP